MTQTDIVALRLRNQHLLRATLKDPVDVLRSLLAVQAQEYESAKWALAQRTKGCVDQQLEQAFAAGRLLRFHVMRPTWHFVAAEDVRWLLKLTAPRLNAVHSYYYRRWELDEALLKRTNRMLTKTLRDGRQLTRNELRTSFANAGIEPGDSERFGHIMFRAELDGVVCSGGRKGNQFTYALLDERVVESRMLEGDEALAELTKRYFTTRGPATIQDYVWWSGLTTSHAKRGIEILGKLLGAEKIDGLTYWYANGKLLRNSSPARVHLLPAYDEYYIAYKDRSAAMHADFDQKTFASKLVFEAPLTIAGRAVGGWKRMIGDGRVTIIVRPFVKLSRADKDAVESAVKKYGAYLELPATIEWK